METIANYVPRAYNFIFDYLADDRTRGFFLVDSPLPLIFIIITYNVFVLKWGQEWMKNRPPYNLKKIILLFDFVQIIFNGYVFFLALNMKWLWGLTFFCYDIDMADNPTTRSISHLAHIYYLVKLTDLFDTIFFVLTKKFGHITFLHVYHHTGMIVVSWGCVKYLPGGHHTFIGVINSLVHVIMYTYYLVTTVYPQKKLFKIKKFITEVQMYQFLVAFIHMSFVLITPGCTYPKWTLFVLLPNLLMIFLLFYNFYRKTYFPDKKIT